MTALGNVPAKRDGIGDNRRGSQSEGYVMELVEGVVDYGAPQFVSNGPCWVEWFSKHSVRVTYWERRKEGKAATHHVIFDIADLLKTHDAWAILLPMLMAEQSEFARQCLDMLSAAN